MGSTIVQIGKWIYPGFWGGPRRGCVRDDGNRQGVWRSGVDTAIAEAPMKAQRRLGLALSWPRITSAFVIDVAVLVAGQSLPRRTAQRRVVGGCRASRRW